MIQFNSNLIQLNNINKFYEIENEKYQVLNNLNLSIDEGEFIIDLYSLPDGLLKSLWDYVNKNTE